MSQPISEISLYERIGGEPAVNAAVDRFYERALADPELKDFFNGVSMSRLKAQQFAFLSQALGGPKQYSGASMRDAHSKLPSIRPIATCNTDMSSLFTTGVSTEKEPNDY